VSSGGRAESESQATSKTLRSQRLLHDEAEDGSMLADKKTKLAERHVDIVENERVFC